MIKLKLTGWTVTKNDECFHFKFFKKPYSIPYVELMVNENLLFTLLVYGWSLPNNFTLYTKYDRSLRNITLYTLVKEINMYKLCEGVQGSELKSFTEHYVSYQIDSSSLQDGHPTQGKMFYRSEDCHILLSNLDKNTCETCVNIEIKGKKTNGEGKQPF